MPADGRGGLHFFAPESDRIVSVNLMLVASIEWASPDVASGSAH